MKRYRAPSYWWDFHHYPDRMTLRIETDDPKSATGVVKEYELPEHGNADLTIAAADRLIADLVAGRRSA